MPRQVSQIRRDHVPVSPASRCLASSTSGRPGVDRIINHLRLTFVTERSPPSRVAYRVVPMAAEAGADKSQSPMIQSPTSFRTTGETVSSILLYSRG